MASVHKDKEGANKKLSMYKTDPFKTDLRRDVIARRRELSKIHLLTREKTQDRRIGKTVSRNLVTIDTSKARGNVEVLRLVIRDLGWREFPFQRRDHNCDVTWNAVTFHDQADIYSGQVNKFPGSLEIFQKVNLFRWLEFMKTLFPDQYDFFPRTWLLPQQFSEFAYEARTLNEKKNKHKSTFIVKPSEGSQGDGIYLLRDPQQYSHVIGRSHVVQEYMNNVLLIERFKFDLRIYVVLRSLEPLEVHICKEGLARFSTIPYEQPNTKNMNETYMHLTNYSLNKKSSEFKISDKDEEGSKRKMSAVFRQMERLGHNVELLWEKIEQMVVKTMIAVVGDLKVEQQGAIPCGKPGPTCFQVLGFDVLVLKNLDPILLEVNSNPSLSITEEHETATGGVEYVISFKDEDVKRKLLRDTLILIAPKNKYTRKRRRHRRRRRYYDNEEDAMDAENQRHQQHHNHRRHRRRERDISIRYEDMEDERHERQKSIFDDAEYSPKKFVRNETCRVFIEGEGEVLFTESGPSNPKYFSDYREVKDQPEGESNTNSNNNNTSNGSNKKSNSKNWETPMDTSDRLPSVFLKSGDKPADIIMEEEEEEDNRENGRDPENNPPRPLPFDLSLLDSSEDEEEEEESCLKEIFPSVYSERFSSERIVERLADIFITCLGVKGCLRLGPTMFRLFARKCRLNKKGITNAAIDILYIDMQRRWEYMNPDRTSGLNFFAFVCGCCKIVTSSSTGASRADKLDDFIEHCSRHLHLSSALEDEALASRSNRHLRSAQDERLGLLPSLADVERARKRVTQEWPELLEETYEDRAFPLPHRKPKKKNIFHVLQSIPK